MKIVWILGILVLIAALVSLSGALYFRRVADDPTTWHVDPLTAVKPGSPNAALIRPQGGDAAAPVYPVTPQALAEALDEVALAEMRTRRIAGEADALWATYVQRSALWGFPDYISVKVFATNGGASYAAFSRARFGRSDLGVNARRLARWQAALDVRLAP
ncbi:uncharacterized protein (DUF1499 family) [Rhodovulum bhavnagarense]|uniref:Uncharacterized protein (DUF1499 family) n=1 Tax=Rhodovulum bhavnagarense TaxID=992286 RepID=A0A4V2SWR3_9RHOB|nr:DUF1499 domain-containing protein [Rhodovulum bhavnagarense]TCP63246.1 uncharacterized protein (DUF1499 family) [Rhodovulum bhavnagarense]